ncbi:hypothetical protein [Halobacterium sp. R2-5]|uniref:hypothetical protein n=1 Tax=Halobacterium sp. R2-5 TaxID=2715751 RepID=UPI0014218D15|nr:hypothetical protein [Halobacterium sp. R2-5]NIC00520.1 hypothetical protein [Halobacterium sp. R2-5]
MKRRAVLAAVTSVAGIAASAGCLGTDSTPGTGAGTTPAATETTDASRTTSIRTTDRLPEDCRPLPDIDGLPARPEPLSEDSARTYAREFEQAYAAATIDEDEELASLVVERVSSESGYYAVELLGETESTTQPTTDGATQTERPVDAREYRVQYLVSERRLVRERRGIAGGTVISQRCWTTGDSA